MKDRLPPHSPEAEQGVLGCILLDAHATLGECIARFKGRSDVFYDLRHGTIFQAMVEMWEARVPIDLLTLQQRLRDQQLLEQVGGLVYLSGLGDTVPSAANLSCYLDIVHDKFVLRKMIHACTEVIGRIYDFEGEVDPLMDQVEADILRVRHLRATHQQVPMREAVAKALEQIDVYHERQGVVMGLSAGYPDLDRLTGGLNPADLFVLAGRPSTGKTSLAMNIAEHVSVDQRLPVGVFSLEMTQAQLVMRMLCSRARVNFRNVRDGFMGASDFPRLTTAASQLSGAPIWIDDSNGLSVLELRAKARRMVSQYGIKLLVVDYLQLLHSTSRKAESRQQEVADISAGLKGLAKELQIPVLVLSQLSRELDREKNRRPRLSDLRESGAIEQDADLVGILYKKPTPSDAEPDRNSVPTNLWIGKQRNGPADEDVELVFVKNLTRFESLAHVSEPPDAQGTMFEQNP